MFRLLTIIKDKKGGKKRKEIILLREIFMNVSQSIWQHPTGFKLGLIIFASIKTRIMLIGHGILNTFLPKWIAHGSELKQDLQSLSSNIWYVHWHK